MCPKSHISCGSHRWEVLQESRAKANRTLPREYTGHSKHPLPTTQEKTQHMGITRWSTPKSDWLLFAARYYLHDPDNHEGVITHLEPDILECEVKWALGSITMNKAGGGDRIPVELFQILKDDGVKVLHSMCQQIWKIQQGPQDWKRSVFIPIPKKGNAKECSNYRTIALIMR